MTDRAFHNYHVTEAQSGQTLAAVLRAVRADQSWNQIKRLISGRQVQVNGNLSLDDTRRVKTGDVVKVWQHPLAKPPDARDVKIHYIDEHLVVVEKPAGVTTLRHAEERNWPAHRKQLQPTLDELLPLALAKHLGWRIPPADNAKSRSGGDGRRDRRPPYNRGRDKANEPKLPTVRAVHRLDRDTSGLMVFARTPTTETGLIRLFSKHHIERSYIAVVHGDVKEQTIDTQLVRDRGDGLRGSLPAGDAAEGSQRAITQVKPVDQFGGYSVVRCRLQTGRTHQIRIHLSEIGHMLCGEKVYVSPLGGKPQRDDSGAPRQALHAAKLGFTHPISGETLVFRSPLPADLATWLVGLRGDRPRG